MLDHAGGKNRPFSLSGYSKRRMLLLINANWNQTAGKDLARQRTSPLVHSLYDNIAEEFQTDPENYSP